jgi:hypothetical protein
MPEHSERGDDTDEEDGERSKLDYVLEVVFELGGLLS